MIVVYSGGESGGYLLKTLVTASGQAIEPTLAVHHKEAPVRRPVRRLEEPIVAIDRFDPSGSNLHCSERAGDRIVGLAENTARGDYAR